MPSTPPAVNHGAVHLQIVQVREATSPFCYTTHSISATKFLVIYVPAHATSIVCTAGLTLHSTGGNYGVSTWTLAALRVVANPI